MPVSSEYDFEHFAQKVKEEIDIKIKSMEEESSDYLVKKDKEAMQNMNIRLEEARFQWDTERYALEQQGHSAITEEVNRLWSRFIKARRTALRSALKIRLEESFPTFAECFISKISKKYERGTFMMPEAYLSLVTTEGFSLQEHKEDKIVFTSGNLYIEYSVERIIEELEDEIITKMNLKDDIWQA